MKMDLSPDKFDRLLFGLWILLCVAAIILIFVPGDAHLIYSIAIGLLIVSYILSYF
jgi:hypothetical protein